MLKHPLTHVAGFCVMIVAAAFIGGRGNFDADLVYQILFDFVIIFNVLCAIFAPFLLHRRTAFRVLNRMTGPSWHTIRGIAWTYIAVWLFLALPTLLLFVGITGPLKLNLEDVVVWDMFRLTYDQSDWMFMLVLFGILGLKGSMLLNRFADILTTGRIGTNHLGEWGAEDELL